MSHAAARIRCFFIGLFYGGFMLALDRCINLKGGLNVTVFVLMCLFAFLIVIGTIKVPKESRHYMPMKPFTILAGFAVSVAVLYAFFGGMAEHENFLQQAAGANSLPPSVQKPFEKYLEWGSQHSLTGKVAEKKP